jgi:hypothetical protein
MKMNPNSEFTQSSFRGRVFDRFVFGTPTAGLAPTIEIPQMPGTYISLIWAAWRLSTSAVVGNRNPILSLLPAGYVTTMQIGVTATAHPANFNAEYVLFQGGPSNVLSLNGGIFEGALPQQLMFDGPVSAQIVTVAQDVGDTVSNYNIIVERVAFK